MNGNSQGTPAIKNALSQAIAEYEQFKGERITWLEALGDCLTGIDERLDYTNLLLMRLGIALGAPAVAPPEAPPTFIPIIYPPPIPGLPPAPVRPTVTPLGTPVSKLNRANITTTDYQTVVEWKIPDHYYGELFQVSMMADGYTNALFRLVIANKEQWADKYLLAPLTQEFRGNELTEGMLVQIQAKTDNEANPFTAYGEVAGKEYQK
ncbi:hypothetical protein ES704_02788 [subsurface metagenome]|jgi:hypothetical protein